MITDANFWDLVYLGVVLANMVILAILWRIMPRTLGQPCDGVRHRTLDLS